MKTSFITTILATETPIAYNHLKKESLKVLRKLSQKSFHALGDSNILSKHKNILNDLVIRRQPLLIVFLIEKNMIWI
jgi:hypothetical protein